MKATAERRGVAQVFAAAFWLVGMSLGAGTASAVESNLSVAKSALEKNDFTQARLQSEIAIVSDPKNADAYVILGQAHIGLKRYHTAMKFFGIALELRPDHRTALYHNGVVQVELGDHDSARKTLKRLGRHCNNECEEYHGLSDILENKSE